MKKRKRLPGFLQPCLPSYNLQQLDLVKDKKLIITAVLNKGDGQATEWLGKIYGKRSIKNVVKNPERGLWYKWIIEYWQKIFDLRIPKKIFKQSVINL